MLAKLAKFRLVAKFELGQVISKLAKLAKFDSERSCVIKTELGHLICSSRRLAEFAGKRTAPLRQRGCSSKCFWAKRETMALKPKTK